MDAATIIDLATYVADVIAIDGSPASRVEMGEMADGSSRHFALVTTYDATNELEQVYRVSTPAQPNSPAWASVYDDWTIEIRVGDGWMDMEFAEVEEAS